MARGGANIRVAAAALCGILLWAARRAPRHGRWRAGSERESLALCATVRPVVATLWQTRGDDIKALAVWREYDPPLIDEQEVVAYCIVDTLGKPLLCKPDARKVGTQAYNAVRKEAAKVAEAQKAAADAVRAARRVAAADPSNLLRVAAAETAGAIAVAAVRESKYNLQIPARTVGAKRKAVPVPEPPPKRLGPITLDRQQEAAEMQRALQSAREFFAGDDEIAVLVAAFETAERDYHQALRAEPHDDWGDDVGEAMRAADRAKGAFEAAREARLRDAQDAADAFGELLDACWDDTRLWADSARGRREAARLKHEWTMAFEWARGMRAALGEVAAEAWRLYSLQGGPYTDGWKAWHAWHADKLAAAADARQRAVCGCVCEGKLTVVGCTMVHRSPC